MSASFRKMFDRQLRELSSLDDPAVSGESLLASGRGSALNSARIQGIPSEDSSGHSLTADHSQREPRVEEA